MFCIIDLTLEHPWDRRGKKIGPASICLSDSGTQKEVLRSFMLGGNEPSELKEEVKRGKSDGLNKQTGFWGVSPVL